MDTLFVQTTRREEIIDITASLRGAVREKGWVDGALLVFCSHTTCGLTINEGADPDVKKDLTKFFRETAPREHAWSHLEGNTDAHIRSSLLGVSLLVPVENNELCLGQWQSIYLYEGDGPRRRSLWLRFLAANE